MILISNLTLNIKDGSTIASTSIYGEDKKTYINIGSGNVFKLEWATPILANGNDTVDHYRLVIKYYELALKYDLTLNEYYDIFNENIGQVNEFYVDSPMLPIAPDQYMLSIYIVAYGKLGSVVTSNVINPYISRGSGIYVKVNSDDYAEPIMKRALAFAYTPSEVLVAADGSTLVESEGKAIHALDEAILKTEDILADCYGESLVALVEAEDADKTLCADITKLLYSTDWTVMQEGYTKDANGTWHTNDIKYEVFQVLNETTGKYEVLTDSANQPIYIL